MKHFFRLTFFLSTVYCANAQYIKLFDFSGTANGKFPVGSLVSDGTFLYGMTRQGGTGTCGSFGCGIVFKIKPDGTGFSKLLDFNGISNGSYPYGSLIFDGTFLFGMTKSGGTSNKGTIFKIKPDGTGYADILNFSGTNGSGPIGSLIIDSTYLYGMTKDGGATNEGVIFKIKPDGTGYTKLLDFTNVNGTHPEGDLVSDGTYLYGMTLSGGTSTTCGNYGCGVLFKIKFDGTGYSKLYDFYIYPDGGNPSGSLISDGTFLYGLTFFGGSIGDGVVFKIKPDGTGFVNLLDFSGLNGSYPFGSLISDGNFLYGMTDEGGGSNFGIIFKIKPDGTDYAKLLDFSGLNGNSPFGSLISDGTFLYGMTSEGGTNSNGVIFKYQYSPTTTTIHKKTIKENLSIYPNPSEGNFSVSLTNCNVEATICVYDVYGNCVLDKVSMKNSSQKIDLTSQPKGIYILETVSNGRREVKKIVLQ